jgi:branched-chain amino acid transport system ATP-binding protein
MDTLLSIHNLVASYGQMDVLHGVSLKVASGEVVGVFGANGAGKTTLLRSISGLVSIKSGTIDFGGVATKGRSARRVARLGIAHVPENRRVFGRRTVHDNLRLGGYVRRRDRAGVESSIERMFEQFPRLGDRSSQLAGTLSGGEQQMLAIAMGLMSDPKMLLLDEPALGLSPKLAEEVFDEIGRLKSQGTTLLLVEQVVHQALRVVDRGVVLELGRVLLEGTRAELEESETVQRAYLG